MRRERRRLASGYFWYFATVGLFLPYWPPYLALRGLDPVEIGLVMGVFSGMRVVGPPVYAHWADISGRRPTLLRGAALAALACAVSFSQVDSTLSIAVALAAYSVLWNGVLSVYDAHVLERLGADSGRYGLLRLWGSVGFIAVAVLAGPGLEAVGLDKLPVVLAVLVALTWASLLGLEQGAARPVARPAGTLRPLLADRRVLVFLATSFLMVASHGAYYNFFSIFLEQLGYGRTAIGLLWAWAVIAEIGVFLMARRLLERFSLRSLTVVALVATSLRWTALALWADLPSVVFASQTLHMASFGLFHLCSVAIAARLFPRQAASLGQALHGSVGFGLGGMSGALASGWIWREVSPAAAFLACAGVAAAAALLATYGLRGLPRRSTGGVENA